MVDEVSLDIETVSLLDLPEVGLYRYAPDLSTRVLCDAFAVNNNPPSIWLPPEPVRKLSSAPSQATPLSTPTMRRLKSCIGALSSCRLAGRNRRRSSAGAARWLQ